MSNRNMQQKFQSIEMEPMDDSSDNSNQTWLPDGFNSLQLRRSEMHELIMDYLLHEGFKEAAERFREEAGIEHARLRLKGSNVPVSMITDPTSNPTDDNQNGGNQKAYNGSLSSSNNNNNHADATPVNNGSNQNNSINPATSNVNIAQTTGQRLSSSSAPNVVPYKSNSNNITSDGNFHRLFDNGSATTTNSTTVNNNNNNNSTANKHPNKNSDYYDEDWHYTSLASKAETPEMMDKRIEIRRLIEEGDILKGQSLINLHYPELLDNHSNIYFRLQQQHLIELIRQQKIDDVLSYVHDQLSVDELGDLTEMEKTLALLAYEQPDKSPYAKLLLPSHRLQLASDINDIILQETLGSIEPTKPRLVILLKLLIWTQSELERKKIQFPKMTDLFNGTILEPRN